MGDRSISAYSDSKRAGRYDADMDLMHPMRHTMLRVGLEMLPFEAEDEITALDLGAGTGFLAGSFLEAHPRAEVICVDGSKEMLGLSGERLGGNIGRVKLIETSFQKLSQSFPSRPEFDLVFSMYALHHLSAAEKEDLLGHVVSWLRPGGWFFNADVVASPFPEIEQRIQELRVEGIHARNAGRDPRFSKPHMIRRFLDDLEQTEGDQPLPVEQDVEILRRAGMSNATIFWKEYREAVYGGSKPLAD